MAVQVVQVTCEKQFVHMRHTPCFQSDIFTCVASLYLPGPKGTSWNGLTPSAGEGAVNAWRSTCSTKNVRSPKRVPCCCAPRPSWHPI